MPSGSVLLDLVRRLPGLSYEGGRLKYQDRDISEIRLNGDSFFKDNINIALRNMPHDRLKQLKIYEAKDDTLDLASEEHLVMDMVTKEPLDMTVFGNADVGTTETVKNYGVGGDIALWWKNKGEVTAEAKTINIPDTYSISEKNVNTNARASFRRDIKQGNINSYVRHIYNNIRNHSTYYSRSFMPDYTQNSTSESVSSSMSKFYDGSANISSRLGKEKRLRLSQNINFFRNYNDGYGLSTDTIENEGEGMVRNTRQTNASHSKMNDINLSGEINYSIKGKRTSSIDFSYRYSNRDNQQTSESYQHTEFLQLNDSVLDINRITQTPSHSDNLSFTLRYQRSLTDDISLQLTYNIENAHSKENRDYDDILADGSLRTVDSLHYDKQDASLRNNFTIYLSYWKDKISMTNNLKISPQHHTRHENQYQRTEDITYNGTYFNNNIDFRYRAKKDGFSVSHYIFNSLPSLDNLSTFVDYSNPMYIRSGNERLKPSLTNRISVQYNLRSFMTVSGGYRTTKDQTVMKTVVDKQTGVRHTSPVNTNGNWDADGYLFLTKTWHDVTYSLRTRYIFRNSVSFVQNSTDLEPIKSNTKWHNLTTDIEMSYSDKHWILKNSIGYTLDRNRNEHLAQTTKGNILRGDANIIYVPGNRLTFSTSCSYSRYFGYDMAAANKAECIWNANIEYVCTKNRRGTLSLEWRDILNSRKGFSASMSNTQWNEHRQFGNTNLLLITFSYRMNSFHSITLK